MTRLRRPAVMRGALAAAAGVLQAISFAPSGVWPLQIASLAVLAALLPTAGTAWRAAAFGWLFAAAWFASGLWWLYISMHDYGGMPALLAAIAVAALASLLAIYYGVAAGAAYRIARGAGPLAASIAFAAAWTLAEWARGTFLTGFPWIAGGYAHTDGPLAGWAPWIGIYGIGAVAAWAAAALGAMARRVSGAWRAAVPAGAAALLGLVLPTGFTTSTGMLRASLLQLDVPQELKFDPEAAGDQFRRLGDALAAARGDLVVAPEGAIPVPLSMLDRDTWTALVHPFAGARRAALIGVFLGDETSGWVNSMVGVGGGAAIGTAAASASGAEASANGERSAATPPAPSYRYGKRHLLPFGEFVPPGFRWFVDLMNIPLGDQTAGRSDAPFEALGQRLRPLICYEDLFGEDIAAGVVGPGGATVLVNASNLAWFGAHVVQDQHLQFSRMRALEFERPVIRATNTGATAAVDHHGRVVARLAPLVVGTLEAEVDGRRGDTPYARWLAAFGLWPIAAAALAALGAVGATNRLRCGPS